MLSYNINYRCYSKVDGGGGGGGGDMDAYVEVCIGVNGLPEHAMKFSPSHYVFCC